MLRATEIPAAVSSARPSSGSPSRAAPSKAPERGGSFREILSQTLAGASEAERALDRALAGVASKRGAGPEELILLQASVYRASRDFELLAKIADRSAGAVRQALQANQGG